MGELQDMKQGMRKKIDFSQMTTLLVLLVLCVVLSVMKPVFLSLNNLINVITQVTVNAIVAVGMTFVILTGGIDLSVGSVLGLAGIVMGMMMKAGMPVRLALIASILTGIVCGTVSGLLVTVGKLPPFIATLGIMNIARAIALTISKGGNMSAFPESFTWIGVGTIFGTGVPVQVLFMLILYGAAYYLLRYWETGRFIYAIGGNKEATRLSGINVRLYEMLTYIVSGFTAALAAVVLTAKLNAAQPTAGMNYELDAVAAVVIGGTSLNGGVGSIWGTLLGAIVIGVIRNGLNLLNANSYLQQGIIGCVIILAVLLDAAKTKSS